MKPVDDKPGRGEIRYWVHIGYGAIYFVKCEVLDIKWDYENEYDVFRCKRLKEIIKTTKVSDVFTIDYAWELQPKIEQAYHLLFMGIFSDNKNFFFQEKAPF